MITEKAIQSVIARADIWINGVMVLSWRKAVVSLLIAIAVIYVGRAIRKG